MKQTVSAIKELIQSKEKETSDIELKSFDKIIGPGDKNRKDIACEIIAFANRNGGRIIFGIKDDGTFENAGNIDSDKLKETIHHICFDNISPVIESSTQYLEDEEGVFFIVYIPKRKGIPHAYIEKRSNHEINNRIYWPRQGYYYNVHQVEIIFNYLGVPDEKRKIY